MKLEWVPWLIQSQPFLPPVSLPKAKGMEGELRAGIGPRGGAVRLFTRWQFPFQACEETSRFFFFFFWDVEKKCNWEKSDASTGWCLATELFHSRNPSVAGFFPLATNALDCHFAVTPLAELFFSPLDTFGLTVFHYFKCNCHRPTFCFNVLMHTCIFWLNDTHSQYAWPCLFLYAFLVSIHTCPAFFFPLTSSHAISSQ